MTHEILSAILTNLSMQSGDTLDYSTQRSGDDEHPDHYQEIEEAIALLDHEIEEALPAIIERVLGDHLKDYPEIRVEGRLQLRAIRQ